MPYALVPKDYTLKKVTTAQKAAVDAKRSHDNVMSLISNPEIIKQKHDYSNQTSVIYTKLCQVYQINLKVSLSES